MDVHAFIDEGRCGFFPLYGYAEYVCLSYYEATDMYVLQSLLKAHLPCPCAVRRGQVSSRNLEFRVCADNH